MEFKRWERQILDDALPSALRKMEALFAGQLQSVRDARARDLVKRKLVAVRLRLNGPTLPDVPRAAKPANPKPRLSDARRDALAANIGKAMRAATAAR